MCLHFIGSSIASFIFQQKKVLNEASITVKTLVYKKKKNNLGLRVIRQKYTHQAKNSQDSTNQKLQEKREFQTNGVQKKWFKKIKADIFNKYNATTSSSTKLQLLLA